MESDYRLQPDASNLSHIPGNDGLPFVGRTPAVLRDLHALATQHLRDHGPVSRIGLLGQRGLLVTGADHFQRIFLDPEQIFSAEKGYDRQLGALYPRGLLLMDFGEHRVNRRLMQDAFRSAALQRYVEMMAPVIERHVQAWGREPGFVFYPAVKRLLLEVGALCFLGIDDFEHEAGAINRLFLELNAGLIALLRIELPFGAWGRARRARRTLEQWCAAMIERRRTSGGGSDMLSHLCRARDELGRPYDARAIIDHTLFLLFAAHDTSTSALTHLAMYLGRDAALQQRLREHLHSAGPEPPDHAGLARLDFARHCFHEAMRLHPPVPMTVRRTVRETRLDGLRVPAHTVLYLPMTINQRDPRWWSEPERFDPDRFAPPRSEQRRHPMCFHPFGGGAHKCIGLHFADLVVKAVLHRLVLRYAFSVPPGYAPRQQWVPLPKPADGVPLALSPVRVPG